MTRLMKLTVLSLVAMVAVAGCNEKESRKAQVSKLQPAKMPTLVVVPDSVKGKWKAVQVAVSDKTAPQQITNTTDRLGDQRAGLRDFAEV